MKSKTSSKFPSKRLLRDFAAIQKDGPAEGIYVKPLKDNDLSELRMMIVGPEGPYHLCLFFFHIKFPKRYPLSPPEVKFHCPYSIRCHPNLYQRATSGSKVCLSILGTWAGPPWTAMMSLMTIAQTIRMILDDAPLRNEPSYATKPIARVQPYTDYVRYVCLRESIEQIYAPVRHGNLDAVEPYIRQNVDIFADEIIDVSNQNLELFSELLSRNAEKFDGKNIKPGGCYGNRTCVGQTFDFGSLISLLR